MKAIVNRLLVIEVLATSELNEHGETLGDVIPARRKRHFEESGEVFQDWPQARFAGARCIGEIILRNRQLYNESSGAGSALKP